MRKETKDVIVTGLALFAMFFGAGNLIFPPFLGLVSGTNWVVCVIGFFLTGIGMPILGILAVSKVGGSIENLAKYVSPTFGKILGTVIILAIGPLLAIPRTEATVFELGVKPILGSVNPYIVSAIYFAITLFFVIKPTGIIDKIGKILTPILLLVISVIIFKGITSPISNPVATGLGNPFSEGFLGGYQTMDALASVLFGGIVMLSLRDKGYTDMKKQTSMTIKAGVIAASGLALVYGSLLYLGATVSGVFPGDITKTQLVVQITEKLLGTYGKYAIGLTVSAACLTTSIGLTATVGNFFSELTNEKLSYKSVVIATVLFSGVIATVGVEQIVKLAVPLLVTVYPVVIVLIIMGIFDNLISNKKAYIGAVYGALIVSLVDALTAIGVNTHFVKQFIDAIPFAEQGFAWIIPSLVGMAITTSLMKKECEVE